MNSDFMFWPGAEPYSLKVSSHLCEASYFLMKPVL